MKPTCLNCLNSYIYSFILSLLKLHSTLNVLEFYKYCNKRFQKDGYIHSEIHCLTLDLLSIVVLRITFFGVCLKSKDLCNCLPFSSFLHSFSGIMGKLEQKNILRTIKQLIQFSYLLL